MRCTLCFGTGVVDGLPCQECYGYGAVSCCEGAYSAKGVSAGDRATVMALDFRPGALNFIDAQQANRGGPYVLDRDTMSAAASNQADAES